MRFIQLLCQNLIFRYFYDHLRFVSVVIFIFFLTPTLCAQQRESKGAESVGYAIRDSIQVNNVEKGGLFLEIKSYFEDFSPTKPGSVTQLYWLDQLPNGDLEVRYVFVNELIDFRVETKFHYANNETQRLALNLGRRVPLSVEVKLWVENGQLKVELL
ncbi:MULTISPECIES: hypothetical protein [unclassified Myroides]|uniref:hypothetical protein n=1 Tax=unclassified Myroides TaxID=2642485 RepID=UPI003D2F998C